MDVVGGAVPGDCLHASNLAVFHDQLLGFQFQHVVVLFVHGLGGLDGCDIAVILGAAVLAAVGGPDLPSGGMEEGRHLGSELKGIAFHPVQGLAGFGNELLHHVQLGVLLAVDGGVFRPVLQEVFRGNDLSAVGFHAGRRVDGHGAGGVGGVSAHLRGLFNAEYGGALLRGGEVGRHAGAAQAHNDHIIAVQVDDFGGFFDGGMPVGGAAAGLLDGQGKGLLHGAGGDCRAGDSVCFKALGFDEPGIEPLFHGGKDHRGVAGGDGLDVRQLAVFEGEVQGHLLGDGIAGYGDGVGAVLDLCRFRAADLPLEHIDGGFDCVAGDCGAGNAVDGFRVHVSQLCAYEGSQGAFVQGRGSSAAHLRRLGGAICGDGGDHTVSIQFHSNGDVPAETGNAGRQRIRRCDADQGHHHRKGKDKRKKFFHLGSSSLQ